ncbi:MAG TPA: hypothetical protein VNZ57_04290 [Longimicrobiales bacterium]|nr:hypothetical protein [Longimicrobiales bacterium]
MRLRQRGGAGVFHDGRERAVDVEREQDSLGALASTTPRGHLSGRLR